MLSSMAKLWPANFGLMGLDWILGIFRYLHVTFLRNFPSSRFGRRHLDENGNPVRDDKGQLKSVSSLTSDIDQTEDHGVSRAAESKLPQTQIDGKAGKSGKEVNRRGKVSGKASVQVRQKTVKVQKNATRTGPGKNPDFELRRRIGEIENANRDQCTELKSTEEEYFEDCDEEVLLLNEKCADEDLDDENNAGIGIVDAEFTFDKLCENLPYESSVGAEITNAVQPTMASVETVAKKTVASGRNHPRKKRRKGKGARPIPSGSAPTLETPTETSGDGRSDVNCELVEMVNDTSFCPISCVVTLPTVNSTIFGGSALGNSRQKPSARVHPSRSTSTTDCALSLSDNDLSPESKASVVDILSVGSKNDDVKLCGAPVELCQNSTSVLSCMEVSESSVKMSEVSSLPVLILNSVKRSYSSGFEVGDDVPGLDSALASCQLSPVSTTSFYECSYVGKCSPIKLKPRSLVNPFSVFDSTTVKPFHSGLQTAEMKPNYVEPARLRPHSTVNPLPTGPVFSRPNSSVKIENTTSKLVIKPDSVDFPLPRTTQVIDPQANEVQKRFSGCQGRWVSTVAMHAEESTHDFTHLNFSDNSFPRDFSPTVVDHLGHSCRGNGFLGNQKSSHSVVPLIRCRKSENYVEYNPIRMTHQLIAGKQPVGTKGNPDRSPVPAPDPVRVTSSSVLRDFRDSTIKEKNSFGRKTTCKPWNLKNGKAVGFRTNFLRQESIQSNESKETNLINFDVWRAQQFLHTEFQTIVEKQKKKSRDVVVFKCN